MDDYFTASNMIGDWVHVHLITGVTVTAMLTHTTETGVRLLRGEDVLIYRYNEIRDLEVTG